MATKTRTLLYKSTAILVGIYFLILGLTKSQTFLAPLVVSIILALLLIPVANKLESFKWPHTIASLTCTFFLFVISLGFFALVSAQASNVVDQWDTIKETMSPKIEQASGFLVKNTPLTEKNVTAINEKFQTSELIGNKNSGANAFSFVSQLFGYVGTYLLVFIYVFFLINYRSKFRKFIIKLFKQEDESKIDKTLSEIVSVVQGYLIGKFKLIAMLAVIYTIGLGISGVNNFILIALIAAILTLIPYIGNLIGFSLALIFGYLTQGDVMVLLGILITFTVTQFVESYILQPYVVGDEVDLNPFFIILSVILGNLLWGITGMVIAIPVLAILNTIFLHVKPLQPLGFLFEKQQGE